MKSILEVEVHIRDLILNLFVFSPRDQRLHPSCLTSGPTEDCIRASRSGGIRASRSGAVQAAHGQKQGSYRADERWLPTRCSVHEDFLAVALAWEHHT